jgi:dienelactone hydrolase
MIAIRHHRLAALAAALLAASRPVTGQDTTTATDDWLAAPVHETAFRTYLEFFAYNAGLSFDAESLDTTTDQGFVREHLRFVSTPGVTVSAHLYRPSQGHGGRGGVILLHGGSANAKNSPTVVRVGQLMARDGWTVIAIDMLHYGERATGLVSRFNTDELAERLYNAPATYLEFVTQTVKDVRRSVDYLVQVRGVDARRVVLGGFSRGAVLATIAGAVETRLAGGILLHGGHMIRQERGHQAAACPANYIQRISPRPLLTINTERDALFIADVAIHPFLRLAHQPVQARWTDGPHGYLSPEDQAAILEWLGALER